MQGALAALPTEATELMLGEMGKTPSNAEFLAAMSTMGLRGRPRASGRLAVGRARRASHGTMRVIRMGTVSAPSGDSPITEKQTRPVRMPLPIQRATTCRVPVLRRP